MSVYKFGNFETEIDATDVEYLKRYEAAKAEYHNMANAIPEGKESERMEYLCNAFFAFFDRVLGEGAHKQMFGNVMSGQLCVKALYTLIEVAKESNESMQTINL